MWIEVVTILGGKRKTPNRKDFWCFGYNFRMFSGFDFTVTTSAKWSARDQTVRDLFISVSRSRVELSCKESYRKTVGCEWLEIEWDINLFF